MVPSAARNLAGNECRLFRCGDPDRRPHVVAGHADRTSGGPRAVAGAGRDRRRSAGRTTRGTADRRARTAARRDRPPAAGTAFRGRGPGAARNVGWRAAHTSWIAFLDDDVVPEPSWRQLLAADLDAAGDAAGSQGRVVVPLPVGRRPTDRERDVGGLGRARWATADMAYRRAALEQVGGFDERFPRAYREDADLALRLRRAGGRLTTGRRVVAHPVRHAPWHVSIGRQAGNADDMLMRRLHGRRWRRDADAGRGRATRHVVGTGVLVLAAGGLLGRSPRLPRRRRCSRGRVVPGHRRVRRGEDPPRPANCSRGGGDDRHERSHPARCDVPPGARRGAGSAPRAPRQAGRRAPRPRRHAGRDVPYNGDPCAVEPMPGHARLSTASASRAYRSL